MATQLKKITSRLDAHYEEMKKCAETFLGYPCNALISTQQTGRFLDFLINNVGDPFVQGTYAMNAHDLEKELIEQFATLLRLAPDERWGYIASGGTEGNLYGLLIGRTRFPSAVLYTSEDSHYSLFKSANTLRMPLEVIPTEKNGEIKYENLEVALRKNLGLPAVINANIGTTMRGAIDKVETILSILQKVGCEDFHIHCDAALHGAILPFLEGSPAFDFSANISSMSISGHKFLGSPVPCGIVLTRKPFVQLLEKDVPYLASKDSTLSGSRSGLAVISLWEKLEQIGMSGWKLWVDQCMEMTSYALQELQKCGWPAWANPHSNIVVIKRPSEKLIRKWQLATQMDESHLVLMPHVTREMIDRFCLDLQERSIAVGTQSKKIKICLATDSDLPTLNSEDRLLQSRLQKRGVEAVPIVWNAGDSHLQDCDGVLIRSCWNYHNQLPQFITWAKGVETQGIPILNDVGIIEWNSHKSYLKEISKLVDVVPTLWLEQGDNDEELLEKIGDLGWNKLIVKPTVSNNAHETHVVEKTAIKTFFPTIERLLNRSSIMVQPYLSEIERYGELSLIVFGGTFSHAVVKRPRQGDFRVQHTHGGSYLPLAVSNEWKRLAEKASTAKSAHAYCRVDIIPTRDKLYVGEMEMIEPFLHFEDGPKSIDRFIDVVLQKVSAQSVSKEKG